MFVIRTVLYIVFVLGLFACGGKKEDSVNVEEPQKVYTRFRGDYKTFNDMPDKHLSAAVNKGISPMMDRADTAQYEKKMVRLPMELDLFKVDKLTHSVPYLVPDASALLVQICANFRDSLDSKKLAHYKPIVTSVTRTMADVEVLTKRNRNASDNSAHTYGTTFDISWKRFQKIGPEGKDEVSVDKLKLVLAQVLHDLRERGKCYIVHERKQACFHITVR
ncbi:DUF5715 family protein [Dysgonomonas macrotermitis]|uniref:Uncharacterized protein n=1 Tax=Dysgonomonas macrotermitis TaxID=1346286 RepID=A0A1M5CYG0_9BACT|nr:DUF5715 family protein [Dysgonomonas macrotermitis]SHF59758.1 hypothetical protein SAMN05444362_10819 [Dysgonomonas macrotermitis]